MRILTYNAQEQLRRAWHRDRISEFPWILLSFLVELHLNFPKIERISIACLSYLIKRWILFPISQSCNRAFHGEAYFMRTTTKVSQLLATVCSNLESDIVFIVRIELFWTSLSFETRSVLLGRYSDPTGVSGWEMIFLVCSPTRDEGKKSVLRVSHTFLRRFPLWWRYPTLGNSWRMEQKLLEFRCSCKYQNVALNSHSGMKFPSSRVSSASRERRFS